MSILPRRFRREKEREQELIQDGFSAAVSGVSPRPWRDQAPDEAGAAPAGSAAEASSYSASSCYSSSSAAVSYGASSSGGYARPAAGTAAMRQDMPARAGATSYAAYAMVGRRVLDFADNGDGTLTVAKCTDPTADDLDIQFEAGACPVTAIAARAFEGCTALRRVILPPSLRQIGEMAFLGCMHLQRIVIPGSVVRVGTLAFAKCSQLERVRIEPGVQALGPSCFSKCTALARVDVPASLTAFGGGVFIGCGRQLCLYGAEETAAQQYAKTYGLRFDSQSWKDDEDLVLSELEDGTLMVMGSRRENPVRVEIPSEICGRRIAAIASRAFFASSALTVLSVGGGVREIGENAFFGCRAMSSISFERGLERVGECAFAGCENLSQVTLPWGTSAVGRMAFFGCSRLSFVKMPTTTRVADLAFDGCAPGLRVFGGVSAGRAQAADRV